MKEEWKDIPNYEGRYQVSNTGLVKSFSYNRETILKDRIARGYKQVALQKDGSRKEYKVHQLVAMVFLGHTINGHQEIVDHIDGCKINNHEWNLQIISSRENKVRSINRIKTSSKYVGVSYSKSNNMWKSQIYTKVDGKKHLGFFCDEESASKAYQDALKKYTDR
jgi:hypothetical protein